MIIKTLILNLRPPFKSLFAPEIIDILLNARGSFSNNNKRREREKKINEFLTYT